MKVTSVLGILISLYTLSSCAPIAASAPKLTQQRRGDSGVINNGTSGPKFSRHTPPRAEIVSAEKYEEYVKGLRAFKLEKIEENDAQLLELREKKSIQSFELKSDLNHVELVAIFVVNVREKELGKSREVRVKIRRIGEDSISLAVDDENTAEETLSLIKKSLIRVTLAERAETLPLNREH